MMLSVLTEGERRYLRETLQECSEYSFDLELACEECIRILDSLEQKTEEQFNDEYIGHRRPAHTPE